MTTSNPAAQREASMIVRANQGPLERRVMPQDVEWTIQSTTYTVLPSGRTTICELTLKNGFTVIGESTVTDLSLNKPLRGQQVAYQRAYEKIFTLENYAMFQRRHVAEMAGDLLDALSNQKE